VSCLNVRFNWYNPNMPNFVYILECADQTLYVGSTNDLVKRLHQHNNLKSGAHYTKIRRPVKMVYSETLDDFGSARKRENEIKSWTRSEKLDLILKQKTHEL
jgi:putative endonuclease